MALLEQFPKSVDFLNKFFFCISKANRTSQNIHNVFISANDRYGFFELYRKWCYRPISERCKNYMYKHLDVFILK